MAVLWGYCFSLYFLKYWLTSSFIPQLYWSGGGVNILLFVIATILLQNPVWSTNHCATLATPPLSSHLLSSWSPVPHQPPTLPSHSLKMLIYHLLSFSSPLLPSFLTISIHTVLDWSIQSCSFCRFNLRYDPSNTLAIPFLDLLAIYSHGSYHLSLSQVGFWEKSKPHALRHPVYEIN